MRRKPSKFHMFRPLSIAKEASASNVRQLFCGPIVKPLEHIGAIQIQFDKSSSEISTDKHHDNFVLPEMECSKPSACDPPLFSIEHLMGIGNGDEKSALSSVRLSLFESETFDRRNTSADDIGLEQNNDSFSHNQFRLFVNKLGYDVDE